MLDEADLADVFQIAEILANNARDPVPAPDAMLRSFWVNSGSGKPPNFSSASRSERDGLRFSSRRVKGWRRKYR